jgi:hypothetical protein
MDSLEVEKNNNFVEIISESDIISNTCSSGNSIEVKCYSHGSPQAKL